MEYFDFEKAAEIDELASDCPEVDEAEAVADYDALFFDKTFTLPTDPRTIAEDLQTLETTEEVPRVSENGVYPMFRAKEPCNFCRYMNTDCFVAQRGVWQNGCTCCISLYRECSFTHAKSHGKFLDTLHVVSEDAYVPTGGLTGKKILRSLGGSAAFEDIDPQQRKTGSRFPREAVKVLRAWLAEHSVHPYPTDEEKDELKAQTGLKRSQICNWLANARRRGKVRLPPRSGSPVLGATGAIAIPRKTLPAGVDVADLTPLERWKYSPPENEPASARDIIRAMSATPFNPSKGTSSSAHTRSTSRKTGSSNDDSSFSGLRVAPSISSHSLDTTTKSSISDMSFASAFSHRSSRGSFKSFETKERRRRRHKTATAVVKQSTLPKSRGARIFQCTFCTDSFPTKYDWQRHEKSLHLALDKWTCAPHGGVITVNDQEVCAFCRHLNPDDEHLEQHNFAACQEKTVQERTFYRKDHLNQHLRLMHSAKYHPWMEQWKSTTSEIKSRCGMCGTTFTTWKDRVDHLAAHFKSGVDMSLWTGDWGFEPFVERLVENSMPPYLIGHERNTMNPWVAPPSAGRGSGDSNVSTIPVPRDASCFYRLQIELSAFIGRNIANNTIPTDQMIQDEARRIIYGTDDPWNQTCADNPTWLVILKRDNGICDIPEAENIDLDDLDMQAPFAANGGLRKPPMHRTPIHIRHDAPALISPGISGSGFCSPSFQSGGFYSGAPSVHGSFIGSAAGSGDVASFAAPSIPNSGAWPSSSNLALSSSAPVSAGMGPATPLDFDVSMLDQLHTGGRDSRKFNGIQISNLDAPPPPLSAHHTSHLSSIIDPDSLSGPPAHLATSAPIAIPVSSSAPFAPDGYFGFDYAAHGGFPSGSFRG
ncbi:hypothetical protein AJ80_00016 [Polytolypa hystricis UAMH7299]|uniref:Homeobox and C2H2 transcription factor n=1 Tax=Polytolypa hystricis (strain UAMH7299) TaxID=1447883 RepID=A0A2B7Z2H8_POLH7|nr:hypothetical protein AJ80_00016 [Polytolypa hystricis UAMH7299]